MLPKLRRQPDGRRVIGQFQKMGQAVFAILSARFIATFRRSFQLNEVIGLTVKLPAWQMRETTTIMPPRLRAIISRLPGFPAKKRINPLGEVTERPIVLVSKTSVPVRVPRVRIPPSPH